MLTEGFKPHFPTFPLFMKTTLAKNVQLKDKTWYIIDAKDQVLGRLAVKISNVLRGRHKPTYTPHVDTGDYVYRD
jgi:large subunit ribosomal protein L13